MTDVKVSMPFQVPVSQIWETIGQFNALPDWHPAVEKSELEAGGTQRRLHLVGGGQILEQLERSEDGQSYTYSILEGPLPVKNYTSTLRVKEGPDGKAEVEWSSSFDPVGSAEDAAEAIRGIYQAGLDNLKKMFGG
jgi:hypothetical protein